MAPRVASSKLGNFLALLADMNASDYFDAAWYRRQSLGARLAPSPALHYLFFGWRQGLNPSPRFDTTFYVSRYRDVDASRANPLKHYLIHGHEEGRLATRSGRIFRDHVHPEASPLPLFGAPAGSKPRLSVLLDDNTPRLLGLGLAPLLGLAAQVALAADWTLRVVIRSRTISTEEVSAAIGFGVNQQRPSVDITRREPGPTDDVDTVADEVWWASSASAYESLRHLVPSDALWWVMTGREASRVSAGEHRELVGTLLAERHTRIIALGESVAKDLPASLLAHTAPVIPLALKGTAAAGGRKTLGVVVAPGHPEALPASSVALIERCLTGGVIDPETWTIRLVGVDWEPLTLSGSVVVEQVSPTTPQQWLGEIGSLDALVCLQSGTEEPWLVQAARGLGIGCATEANTDAVSAALEGAAGGRSAPQPSWAEVVAPIVAAMESVRG